MTTLFNSIRQRPVIWAVAAVLVIGGILSLGGSEGAHAEAPAMAMPVPTVTVQTVAEQDVQVWSEFSARMNAVDYAQIRPEVSGRITEIRFRDGQMVKQGDTLIVIDPRPYEAAKSKAEAALSSAATNAQFAKTELDRANNLVRSDTIAKQAVDARANENRTAAANLRVAEADLKQANLDLDRAYVKAPISGRVSRAEITVGNLVQSGSGAPVLTSIVSNDGIYADFEVDEQTYMQIRQHAPTQEQELQIPVELTAKGNASRSYQGMLYSFDNHIDSNSGTIRARAKFDNVDNSLMPGMFASVKIASTKNAKGILVPERAIGSDQNKKFVFTVDAAKKVQYREVTLGQKANNQPIVLAGLQSGDRVIVDGVMHVRPDMQVEVKEAANQNTVSVEPTNETVSESSGASVAIQ